MLSSPLFIQFASPLCETGSQVDKLKLQFPASKLALHLSRLCMGNK
jgi:hypothetical protein